MLAQLLAGLDEGAGDVAVLDQAVVLGDPRGAREAGGGRVAGVGHRDHEVGVDGRLAPEDLAHPAAHLLHDPALEPAVGAREVDVLEDAERLACVLLTACRTSSPRGPIETISPGLTSRISLAPMMSKAQLSEATTKLLSSSLPSDERPDAVRVAEGDDRVAGHDDGRVGALHLLHRGDDGILDRRLLGGGEQRRDDLRVGGAAEADALLVRARRRARPRWSGCRCGRARPRACPRARPAACSPSRRRRWSSNGRGRSPPRPAARAASARRRPGRRGRCRAAS